MFALIMLTARGAASRKICSTPSTVRVSAAFGGCTANTGIVGVRHSLSLCSLLLLFSHINSYQKSRVRGHTKVLEP